MTYVEVSADEFFGIINTCVPRRFHAIPGGIQTYYDGGYEELKFVGPYEWQGHMKFYIKTSTQKENN